MDYNITNSKRVQVIDRTLDIIEQLAITDGPLSITELSKRALLPKSTVHRILSMLTSRHYVEKDTETNGYMLGYKVVQIASCYLNKIMLCTEAAPFMHQLASAFDAISYLAVLENTEVMYLQKIEKVSSIHQYACIGKREPLYCTALGKVLLSGLPEDEREQVIRQITFKKFTPATIISKDDLTTEVKLASVDGYAVDKGEHLSNNFCLAAPIFDYSRRMIAAISVSGEYIFGLYPKAIVQQKVTNAAYLISQKMGYTSPARNE